MTFPLGGSRGGEARTYGNLMATMLLGGLWHGANWTFVFWGGLQGFWLSIERAFGRLRKKDTDSDTAAFHPGGWLVTMLVVGLGWLFFRARNIDQALTMLGNLRNFGWRPEFLPMIGYLGVLALATLAIDLRLELYGEEYPFEKTHPRWAIASAAVLCVVMALAGPMDSNAFIYFQF